VEALGEPGDVLIGISTSGNSASVNNAFRKAREKGMATIGLLGKDGGTSKALVDLAIVVPSEDTRESRKVTSPSATSFSRRSNRRCSDRKSRVLP